jgi:hypothetical protein
VPAARPVPVQPVQGRPVSGSPVSGRPVVGGPVQGRSPATARPVAAHPAALPLQPWPRPGQPWPARGQHGQPRPVYREPHPIRSGAVWSGIGATVLWFLMFGLVSWTAQVYVWSTVLAAALALGTAAVLARYGDRGVAVGAAATAGAGLAIPGIVVLVDAINGHWLPW